MKSTSFFRVVPRTVVPAVGFIVLALLGFPSFSQVTLPNGVTVPKEKFVVYIMIGHSNMVGRETQFDVQPDPHAWSFFIRDCCQPYSDHAWIPAKDCIHMDNGAAGDGPCMHFLKKMVREFPEYYFGVVENANSGVQCRANYQKNNGAGTLDLYSEMVNALDVIKDKVTFGGIVCMLGIPEAANGTDSLCREFSNDIALMVRQFRDTLRLPDLPFLMGAFERDGPSVATLAPHWQVIDSQTNLVPSKVPVSALVPSDSLFYTDRWHYTWASYEIWTQRAVDIIKARGWYPAASRVIPADNAERVRRAHAGSPAPGMWTDALGRKTAVAGVPSGQRDGLGPHRVIVSKHKKALEGF